MLNGVRHPLRFSSSIAHDQSGLEMSVYSPVYRAARLQEEGERTDTRRIAMSNFGRTSLVPLSRRGRLAGVGALSLALVAAAGVYGHARTHADEPYANSIPAPTAYVGLFK